MAITTTSHKPFQKLFMDIVGPLPETSLSNKYILTAQDDLTKYSFAIAISNMEAKTVAEALVTNIICSFGTPESILTDQGSNFLSQIFKNICKFFNIKKLQTTAYHPQSNGALERCHAGLAAYLRNFTSHDHSNWDKWLPYAMLCYNTTPHSSSKFSPYELIFGHKPILPSSLASPPSPIYNYEDYLTELRNKLQNAHQVVRENLIKGKEISKAYYDRNSQETQFSVGDQVYYRNQARKNKLHSLWFGPFHISEINFPLNSTIIIKNKPKRVHNCDLKIYYS